MIAALVEDFLVAEIFLHVLLEGYAVGPEQEASHLLEAEAVSLHATDIELIELFQFLLEEVLARFGLRLLLLAFHLFARSVLPRDLDGAHAVQEGDGALVEVEAIVVKDLHHYLAIRVTLEGDPLDCLVDLPL